MNAVSRNPKSKRTFGPAQKDKVQMYFTKDAEKGYTSFDECYKTWWELALIKRHVDLSVVFDMNKDY